MNLAIANRNDGQMTFKRIEPVFGFLEKREVTFIENIQLVEQDCNG
jgi:hypothetical protein